MFLLIMGNIAFEKNIKMLKWRLMLNVQNTSTTNRQTDAKMPETEKYLL